MTMSGGDGSDDDQGAAPKLDLFPTATLEHIADSRTGVAPSPDGNIVRIPDWRGGHPVDLGSPFDFAPPPRPEDAEAQRLALLGPTYGGLTGSNDPGFDPTFNDQVAAESAVAMLPAALLGSIAKPAVGYVYGLLDKIPEAFRRPFERNFGLLIDNGMSLATDAAMPLVGMTVDKFYPDGRGLPPAASIDLQAHGQVATSCAETAAATILKWSGEPVALGDVDTQAAWATGASGLVDEELQRRGLSLIAGPGDLGKLKAFLANQYPVMISVGWANGGGHMVVVTGYDDHAKTVTIDNWYGTGTVDKVPYSQFLPDWQRHFNLMTVVMPQRDTRLTELRQAGDPRRPDQIYEGLTLSDFWVDPTGKVFVEGAYRYVGAHTDVTVRVNFSQLETGLEHQLNGSVAVKRELTTGWYLGLSIDKLSLQGHDDKWTSFSTVPLAIYGDLKAPGFEIKAGAEDGGFQASVTADLGRLVSGLGLAVNYSQDADHSWRLFATITGKI